MTCIKCKGQMSELRPLNMVGRFKGKSVTVEIIGRECEQCGHQSIEGSRMSEFMQKVADAYRSMRGLLTSADIRKKRERLKMSQLEFAAYLGVGVAGVKRWELGEIQSKGVDELIRLKTDTKYAEALLTDLYQRLSHANRGVTVTTAARADRRRSSRLGVTTECGQLAA